MTQRKQKQRALAAYLLLASTRASLLGPLLRAQPPPSRTSPLVCTSVESNAVETAQLNAERRRLVTELAELDAKLEAAEAASRVSVRPVGATDPAVGLGSSSSAFEPSFGYLSKSAGSYVDTLNTAPLDGRAGPPSNFFDLAIRNFRREFSELLTALDSMGESTPDANGAEASAAAELKLANASTAAEAETSAALRRALNGLKLSSANVWRREARRPQVNSPLILKTPYYGLCFLLDVAFDGRPIARFWFLETVARIPYMSYISLLHLYESLGWWRRSAQARPSPPALGPTPTWGPAAAG